MCYGDDARPPLPPVSGGAAGASDLTLRAADGNELMAFAARAARPSGVGMVILPDVRGLHEFYKELAQRFAEAGIDAVAIDYFGRTAGHGARDEAFVFRPHVEQTTPDGVDADAAAAIAYLRSAEGGAVARVYTVGFCFGGSNSWRQSASQPGLAGAIGFYGVPSRVRNSIGEMKAPLLVMVAGADHTPIAEFEQFDRELAAAGVAHKTVVYDGAPHSFFDRTFAEYAAACEDAWRQMLDFVGEPVPA
ncbi:MAG TPA: dienelactone hydrolase family protein [Thermomicrobiales bacterium]